MKDDFYDIANYYTIYVNRKYIRHIRFVGQIQFFNRVTMEGEYIKKRIYFK